MKYSLRSLMIVAMLLPPLLAGVYFALLDFRLFAIAFGLIFCGGLVVVALTCLVAMEKKLNELKRNWPVKPEPAEPAVSDPNPYELPKEVNSLPPVKAGVFLGTLLLLSIPAGCICGGITCVAVDNSGLGGMGGYGIFIGLSVVVLIPIIAMSAGWLRQCIRAEKRRERRGF